MRTKIKHPYQVPEGFFKDFRKNLEVEITKIQPSNRKTFFVKRFSLVKYAAILVIVAGVGYVTMHIMRKSDNSVEENLQITVEEVLSQISEEELTDFIIENISPEKLEQINSEP
jgi:hypothetical protein